MRKFYKPLQTLFRKFTAVSISLLLLFVPLRTSLGCGYEDWDPEAMYLSFFRPELLNKPKYLPLAFTFERFYGGSDLLPGEYAGYRDENTEDWQKYFGSAVNAEHIRSLIYETSLDELYTLRQLVEGKKAEGPLPAPDNQAIRRLLNTADVDFVDYLIYAKKCEPYAVSTLDWDLHQVPRDYAEMLKLASEGEEAYRKTAKVFLKLRYAFQASRMAFYAEDRERCIALYNKLVVPLNIESPIKYWALCNKSGAEKDDVAAAYGFMQVFRHSIEKRMAAYTSFKWTVNEDTELHRLLQMCRNNQEKSMVYFLLSIDPDAYMLDNMRIIHALAPNSEELEVLLVREINKIEYILNLNTDYWYDGQYGQQAEITKVYADSLSFFVDQAAWEKNRTNKDLWITASGYLHFLAGRYDEAEAQLKRLHTVARNNNPYHEPARIIMAAMAVQRAEKPSPQLESRILADLEWMQQAGGQTRARSDAFKYIIGSLAELYRKSGEVFMADLLARTEIAYGNLDSANLGSRLKFLHKTNKTPFEQFVAKRQQYNQNHLLEAMGTFHLQHYEMEQALKYFQQVDAAFWSNEHQWWLPDGKHLPANPFKSRLKDCNDCDYEQPQDTLYTKLTLVQRILQLQQQAQKPMNANDAAQVYHLLGNVYYNISTYGNSWWATQYYFSWPYYLESMYNSDPDEEETTNAFSAATDCTPAENWYIKAAQTTRDKNFAARNYFMAAKCEERMNATGVDDFGRLSIPVEHRNHFKVLKSKYRNTAFYKEAIRECSYFAAYVKLK